MHGWISPSCMGVLQGYWFGDWWTVWLPWGVTCYLTCWLHHVSWHNAWSFKSHVHHVIKCPDWPSIQGCRPYSIKPCEHHVNGSRIPCSGEGPTPKCVQSCESGYKLTYPKDKHYGGLGCYLHVWINLTVHEYVLLCWALTGYTAYSIERDEQQIQTEIMTNGPVEGAFTVYADFPTYKSGEGSFNIIFL